MRLWQTLLFAVVGILGGAVAQFPRAASAETPDTALAKMLEDARAEAAVPGACTAPHLDRLVHIFCEKRLRAGIREYYPLFGTREGEARSGYDVDVGRAVAKHLGVDPVFTRVNAASHADVEIVLHPWVRPHLDPRAVAARETA